MSIQITELRSNFIDLAAEIVVAYVANNSVPVSELPRLIRSVHGAVAGLASTAPYSAPTSVDRPERPTAAQIRKSLRTQDILSFIDGKPYKTLKRHLTAHGLDPRSYRERYGLPTDYPMVAPSYAERRSALARAIGLGRPGAMAENASRERREVA